MGPWGGPFGPRGGGAVIFLGEKTLILGVGAALWVPPVPPRGARCHFWPPPSQLGVQGSRPGGVATPKGGGQTLPHPFLVHPNPFLGSPTPHGGVLLPCPPSPSWGAPAPAPPSPLGGPGTGSPPPGRRGGDTWDPRRPSWGAPSPPAPAWDCKQRPPRRPRLLLRAHWPGLSHLISIHYPASSPLPGGERHRDAAATMKPPRGPPLLAGLLLLWAAGEGRAQEVQAENVTVLEGSTAEITCRLHHYDGSIVVIQNPARQTLFFNGTRALKDERFQLAEFTQRQLRIQLARARLDDEGGYFCQLYTDDTHHQIATLTVLVPPETPVVEVTEPAVEGGEVELSCVVPRARPPATLRWYRDRRELKDAPTARIHPSQSVLREGDTLVLTCAVNGNPLPTDIAWSRGNESLPERARAEGEVLTLPALSPQDNGTYSCQAGNRHGRASDHYVLVVYDPGAVVAAQRSVPYAIVGGILALLVFLLICVLVTMVWCSIRQKGSYLTHEASGLDEHGEAREAFLNGADGHKRK
uniref:Cell adhesion molecule 4 n=1 Tax=Cairina moschata TaxID=8855 RepID=A0A8C3BR79_CAIMO